MLTNRLRILPGTSKHGSSSSRDQGLSNGQQWRRSRHCTHTRKHRIYSSTEGDGGDVLSIRGMYDEARMMLPTLDQSNRLARESEIPAVESEIKWQEADTKQSEIRNRVNSAIGELEVACQKVLTVPCCTRGTSTSDRDPACDMMLHHTNFRMEEFHNNQKKSGKDVTLWRLFNGSVSMNAFDVLPGGHLGKQLACCSIDDEPYLIACIAVSMDPFVDNMSAPRSLMLHWSVTDHEGGSWHNNIPMGWHTYPGISNPHGTMAWQTNLAHYNPALLKESTEEENITQISVHSVVVQIPMAGHFLEESGGGIKFILKRTDNCDDVWIKSRHHKHDFYLSLDDAISYLNPPTLRQQSEDTLDSKVQEQDVDVEEESSAKFIWARALAEDVIKSLYFDNAVEKYEPHYLWVEKIARWVEINDYDMNAGSSPSQYVKEIRLLLDLLWSETSINGSDYNDQKELFFLKTECSKIEADIEALDAAEIQLRAIQLEKDRMWEERENAIKEASRVQQEVKNRVEELRRRILKKAGRDTEVTIDDLKALSSRIVLGSEGHDKGAGMFKKWFGGSDRPIKHVFVSESVERVKGIDAHVVTQVYFEGDGAAVDDAMKADREDHPEEDLEASPSSEEKQQIFPFDTVLVSFAFGEAFPDKISTSQLSLHYGLVTKQHGTWISAPERTQIAIRREDTSESDVLEFEAFKIKHASGKNVFVDPIVRGLCIRLPVDDLRAKRIVGVEFVLKSGDDIWMGKEGGDSNFFVHIPMIKE